MFFSIILSQNENINPPLESVVGLLSDHFIKVNIGYHSPGRLSSFSLPPESILIALFSAAIAFLPATASSCCFIQMLNNRTECNKGADDTGPQNRKKSLNNRKGQAATGLSL